eukprot:362129-Chlamydomonas_euryale.AAC.8
MAMCCASIAWLSAAADKSTCHKNWWLEASDKPVHHACTGTSYHNKASQQIHLATGAQWDTGCGLHDTYVTCLQASASHKWYKNGGQSKGQLGPLGLPRKWLVVRSVKVNLVVPRHNCKDCSTCQHEASTGDEKRGLPAGRPIVQQAHRHDTHDTGNGAHRVGQAEHCRRIPRRQVLMRAVQPGKAEAAETERQRDACDQQVGMRRDRRCARGQQDGRRHQERDHLRGFAHQRKRHARGQRGVG